MEGKITFIVPVYNIENYIDKCIQSIVSQTYKNIEIILVDDGSEDGTGSLCDQWAGQDKRIKVIHKENGGLSSARNVGLEAAKGDFFLFVDGDDFVEPIMAEYLMKLYNQYDEGPELIQFFYDENYGGKEKTAAWEGLPEYCTDRYSMFMKVYELGGIAVSACTKMYDRKLFSDLRFKEGIIYEDEYMISDILEKCNSCVYSEQILYHYVIRSGSTIKSGFQPKRLDIFQAFDHRNKCFRELGYEELLNKTYRKEFYILLYMYCDAKNGRYIEECIYIKKRMEMLRQTILLGGPYKEKLLFLLCRVTLSTMDCFYYVRKIFGKIE